MKREKLKKLKGERRTFQGVFVRYGIKHNWHGISEHQVSIEIQPKEDEHNDQTCPGDVSDYQPKQRCCNGYEIEVSQKVERVVQR